MSARIFSGGNSVAGVLVFRIGDEEDGDVEFCRKRGERRSSLRRAIVARDMMDPWVRGFPNTGSGCAGS